MLCCTSKTNKSFCGLLVRGLIFEVPETGDGEAEYRARCERLPDHENREDSGFSYQTNETHMERERHQRSTLGIDVERRVRDHGSTVFFLCCCENRHRDAASSSYSIIGGFRSK